MNMTMAPTLSLQQGLPEQGAISTGAHLALQGISPNGALLWEPAKQTTSFATSNEGEKTYMKTKFTRFTCPNK
jgi:hypothetical protein